ncbi:MAG: LysR family transcriptional regulator [Burkholderiaceae bacterium]|jgi:DNA-binding transcriptional LysR family regulator
MSLRNLTLRQLKIFEAVARHLSFSRAAEELHLSQPAVSMQVKDLESSVELALFERVGKTLFVTDAGRELLRHTRDVLRALTDAQETLDHLKGLERGRVSVAVVSTAKYFAPELLARFRERHRAIELRLVVHNREVVIEQLCTNQVDLAIMGTPPAAPAMRAEAFAPHPNVIIAPPHHPLASRRRLPVSALRDEVFLVREPGSGTRSAMQKFFEERDIEVLVGMEMASNESIKQAVMAGLGISFLSRHTVELELQTGRLVLLNVVGLPVVRNWHVVHLMDKRLSPSAFALRSFVLEQGREILRATVGGQ